MGNTVELERCGWAEKKRETDSILTLKHFQGLVPRAERLCSHRDTSGLRSSSFVSRKSSTSSHSETRDGSWISV